MTELPKKDGEVYDLDQHLHEIIHIQDQNVEDMHDLTLAKRLEAIPNSVKAQAYKEFIETDSDLTQLAIQFQLPLQVLQVWAREGKWSIRKNQIEEEAKAAADASLLQYRHAQRLQLVKDIVDINKQILNTVKTKLPKDSEEIASTELRRLTETLTMASRNLSSAVGLDVAAEAKQENKNQKIPLSIKGVHVKVLDSAKKANGESKRTDKKEG